MTRQTIFALSSAPGRAAVAVVRLSGPEAGAALTALSPRGLPEPRRAVLRRLFDPADGSLLDEALLLWLPGPRSETGEDMAELHLHGGPAVVSGVLTALARLPGLRLAEPGEFTRRAFLAGRLDLTGVEGLADLIAAETAAQRKQALNQLGGALTRRLEAWRARLVGALAHLEATIDFAEEELPADTAAELPATLAAVLDEIEQALVGAAAGERLRQGLRVVLLGAPNAGKSTLLNALARRDVAIVSARPGTTRDVIEVQLDLRGLPVTLVDTAGLRAVEDEIEAEGIQRARRAAAGADLCLLLVEPGGEAPPDSADLSDRTLRVGTKQDLAPASGQTDLSISAKTGAGLDALEARLAEEAAALLWSGGGEAPLVTRARQRAALEETAEALRRALGAPAAELRAEDLRLALRGLGRLAGRVDVEELLDVIFRDFCIGK